MSHGPESRGEKDNGQERRGPADSGKQDARPKIVCPGDPRHSNARRERPPDAPQSPCPLRRAAPVRVAPFGSEQVDVACRSRRRRDRNLGPAHITKEALAHAAFGGPELDPPRLGAAQAFAEAGDSLARKKFEHKD